MEEQTIRTKRNEHTFSSMKDTHLFGWNVRIQGSYTTFEPVIANAFVHIWMYSYFFLRTLGKTVWWRKHLTQLQITQFFFDLLSTPYKIYLHWIGQCNGIVTTVSKDSLQSEREKIDVLFCFLWREYRTRHFRIHRNLFVSVALFELLCSNLHWKTSSKWSQLQRRLNK